MDDNQHCTGSSCDHRRSCGVNFAEETQEEKTAGGVLAYEMDMAFMLGQYETAGHPYISYDSGSCDRNRIDRIPAGNRTGDEEGASDHGRRGRKRYGNSYPGHHRRQAKGSDDHRPPAGRGAEAGCGGSCLSDTFRRRPVLI